MNQFLPFCLFKQNPTILMHNYLWCYDYKTITVFKRWRQKERDRSKKVLTFHKIVKIVWWTLVRTVFAETFSQCFFFVIVTVQCDCNIKRSVTHIYCIIIIILVCTGSSLWYHIIVHIFIVYVVWGACGCDTLPSVDSIVTLCIRNMS